MSRVLKVTAVLAVGIFAHIASAHAADEFKLSNNQRIACGRGLNAGKLQTINCKSYAFIFNTRTSEFYRCQVSVGVTRDNKEVLKIDSYLDLLICSGAMMHFNTRLTLLLR